MKIIVSIIKGIGSLIEASGSESKGKHVVGKVAGRRAMKSLKKLRF